MPAGVVAMHALTLSPIAFATCKALNQEQRLSHHTTSTTESGCLIPPPSNSPRRRGRRSSYRGASRKAASQWPAGIIGTCAHALRCRRLEHVCTRLWAKFWLWAQSRLTHPTLCMCLTSTTSIPDLTRPTIRHVASSDGSDARVMTKLVPLGASPACKAVIRLRWLGVSAVTQGPVGTRTQIM